MQPKGTWVSEGEYATLTFLRRYRHSAERVWNALATPEGLQGWLLCTHAEIDARVGGRCNLVSGPGQYRSTGTILTWDPPRVFEYEWNVAPVPEMPRGERAIFRYELTPDGDSTYLRVTYRRITTATARGFLPGIHALLDRLEAQLHRERMPDWLERFGELQTVYTEWSGHEAHPDQ